MKKGTIMNKADFLKKGDYAKEEYEGLIVCADNSTGKYNLGVEIDDENIVIIDQATPEQVNQRVQELSAKVPEIQKQYQTGSHIYHTSSEME
ncbi:MAG: hypothetical protein GXY16_08605 [Syntrophomonadaceae bacterium]|nr:hypothetical protein [Syntrophomonadaceae bacterium]